MQGRSASFPRFPQESNAVFKHFTTPIVLFPCTILFCFAFVLSASAAELYSADFRTWGTSNWVPFNGVWECSEGTLAQTQQEWGKYSALSDLRFYEGSIKFRVKIPTMHKEGSVFFGIILRHTVNRKDVILYVKNDSVFLSQAGKDVLMGHFSPTMGVSYEVVIEKATNIMSFEIDGNYIGSSTFIGKDVVGYVGLYTEGKISFSNFEVEGVWHLQTPSNDNLGKTSIMELEFSEWDPILSDSDNDDISGGLYIYYKNIGDRDLIIDRISFAGRNFDPQLPPPWIAYIRQHPSIIRPGDVGQLEIRISGLDKSQIIETINDDLNKIPIELIPRGGIGVKTVANISKRLPIQINFGAFGEDLKTLYLYLQNNQVLFNERSETFTIKRIDVNSVDVTTQSQIGSVTLSDDVVPIVVHLVHPFLKGETVRVVVLTDQGVRTGYVLRAFPSKFHTMVYIANNARRDYLQDVKAHGSSAVNITNPDVLEKYNFALVRQRGRTIGFIDDAYGNISETLAAIWIDEVDKQWGHPVRRLSGNLIAAERFLDRRKLRLPFYVYNYVDVKGSARSGHLTLPDAVMHAYGYHLCSGLEEGFGFIDDLPHREYRLSRRPFWPYFRDAEIPVPRCVANKTTKPLSLRFQRTLTPKEQRRLVFSSVIQGAKSVAYWGYWAYPMSKYYYITEPVLRLGLGGSAGNKVGPYVLDDKIASMLKDVWDEIGRINVELRTLGPLIAISDVAYSAKLLKVEPSTMQHGKLSAEAVALICGIDTIILLIVNHSLHFNKTDEKTGPLCDPTPPVYDPLNVQVELKIPEWLNPKYSFSVDFDSITHAAPNRDTLSLTFSVRNLDVTKIYVITQNPAVVTQCQSRHETIRTLYHEAATVVPIPDQNWKDIDVK